MTPSTAAAQLPRLLLGLGLACALAGCGADNSPTDATPDVRDSSRTDAGADAADAVLSDSAADSRMDVPDVATHDAVAVDTAIDAPADAPADAAGADVATDAALATDAPADAGRFALPATCAASAECGPGARCDTRINRCVCEEGRAPCGDACCALRRVRDLPLAMGGHAPEVGSDAAGNVYVLYKTGSTTVRLATVTPAGATSSETIATSSGVDDDADLAVAPDGTIDIALHRTASGRDGAFTLYRRAPGAATFTTMSLRTTSPTAFAYDAAVSISRAANGDIYAAVSARSGDGTMGLAMTTYDSGSGLWSTLPTVLTYHGHARSELFARADGFFVGVHDLAYGGRYEHFDLTARSLGIVAIAAPVFYGRGETAAAMTDAGELFTFTRGTLARSGGGLSESVPFAGLSAGARSDIDMAVDADGNPALLSHSATSHTVTLMVRMPRGGYASVTWPESSWVPFPMTSEWLSLDLERLPSGNLAVVAGDARDVGSLRYFELAR